MKNWYVFVLPVKNWYGFSQMWWIGINLSQMWRFIRVKNWYQSITRVKNRYKILTHANIWYQIPTSYVNNWYQIIQMGRNVSDRITNAYFFLSHDFGRTWAIGLHWVLIMPVTALLYGIHWLYLLLPKKRIFYIVSKSVSHSSVTLWLWEYVAFCLWTNNYLHMKA